MNEKMQDTVKNEGRELLTERMPEKVSGGSPDGFEWPETVDCPKCGATVWYSERGQYAYECDCGWSSGRSE